MPDLDLDNKEFLQKIKEYYFPSDLQEKATLGKVDLETTLKYARCLEISLYATSHMGLSSFVSWAYKKEDIIFGEFEPHSLEVQREVNSL